MGESLEHGVRTSKDTQEPPRWHALAWTVAAQILTFVGTVIGAIVLVQVLLAWAPGDAIDSLPNPEESRALLAAEWRLDQPLPIQILTTIWDLAHGDLRTSLTYRPGMPVTEVLVRPAMRSLGLVFGATALITAWGGLLAWWTAGKRSVSRMGVQAISVMPVFLLAHLAVEGLNTATWAAMASGWIARPTWFALPLEAHPLRTSLAILLLAVGSGALSEVHGELENALLRIRSSGYVDAAIARGEPTWPHVALNLVPPLVSILARRVAFFLGGLVILEKVLLLNGIGAILWQSAILRDYPLALGITLVLAGTVSVVRLVADGLRAWVDPRLRLSVGGR